MTYLLALVAAIAFGANWVLQQHEAGRAPATLQLRPIRLLEHLIRRPLWLVGLLALAIGGAAQEDALASGSLPVIESLLVLDLVFALLLADRLSRHSVGRSQWAGAAAVCIGLATFLIAGNPTPGHSAGADSRWVLVLAVVGGLCGLLCALAWRRPGTVRAVSCAMTAAVLFGLSDGLSKAAFSVSVPGIFATWQLYGLIGAAVVAVAASQVAYNAAPLVVSLPSLAVGEPVTGVMIGVMVLHVHFRTGAVATAIEVGAAVTIVVGSWVVGRARVLDLITEYAETHAHVKPTDP
jgi:drug/metabolite transporter (DMT)-like permease